jgi:hypothetical protein
MHFLHRKTITAKKGVESKRDPDLVTAAVDLNVKQLAVITARQHGKIIATRFVADHGLDQHRYRHLKRIARKQWQSRKPVKGERSSNLHRLEDTTWGDTLLECGRNTGRPD